MPTDEAEGLTREIAQVPEYILRAIIREGEPDEGTIRRMLPTRHRHLAAEIRRRLIGGPADPAAGAAEPAAAGPDPDPAPAPAPAGFIARRPAEPPAQAAAAAPAGDAAPAPAAAAPDPARPVNPVVAEFDELTGGGAADAAVMDPADALPATGEHFAQYLGGAGEPIGEVRVRRRPVADGARIELTWADPPGVTEPVRIYRVIAADGEARPNPDEGPLALTTVGHGYVEAERDGVAFRHYQVWLNAGADLRAALDAQPRLVGEDIAVAPVPGFVTRVSQGVVEGTWATVPGYAGIRVYAAPAADPGPLEVPGNLLAEGVTARGFEHRAPVRGAAMRYRLVPEVEFRGRRVVAAAGGRVAEVHVPAELAAVELQLCERFTDAGGDDRIALSWYAPAAGVVRIYLGDRSPAPDLSFEQVPEEALARDPALAPANLVGSYAPGPEGAQRDERVMWPAGLDEVHLTPVTVVDGRAAVGVTRVLQRVAPIRDAELAERGAGQLITFAWPAGAAMVKVETAPLGAADPADRVFRGELDEAGYRRAGGIRLRLDPFGATVTLTPRSIYAGRETAAEPAVLTYRGLRTYRWRLEPDPRGLLLRLWCSGAEDRNPPRFQLVHHPTRLPLCPEDAAEAGAGVLRTTPVEAGTGRALAEPGIVLAPDALAGGYDAAAAGPAWLVAAGELSRLRPGQWLRPFILDGDAGGRFAAGADPAAAAAAGPRRILVDDAAVDTMHLPPENWRT